jgi:hypothetical protein
MPLFVIVNHKARVIASCPIDSPLTAIDTILNAFPWRRTDELTFYNTQNFDAAALQVMINKHIKDGYTLHSPIQL